MLAHARDSGRTCQCLAVDSSCSASCLSLNTVTRVKCLLAKSNHFAKDVRLRSPRDALASTHPRALCFCWHLAPTNVVSHEGQCGPDGRTEQD
jgi:hypothetical protein